jgi:predicted DNA-binding helix-hairpin-helix protein
VETIERIYSLSQNMYLEPAGDGFNTSLSEQKRSSLCVSKAILPNGKSVSLLKTLLTSACENDCFYCPFRAGRDFKRATLSPDEMAQGFMGFYRAGIVQGLFLSSGVAGGGVRTQDKLLATAEILRNRYQFRGYIHLKLMPGSEYDQVEQAMKFSNRVSINLEAPNPDRLMKLAPGKVFFTDLMRPMTWVDRIRKTKPSSQGWNGRWPSLTTQFVVGGSGESDSELLETTRYLHQNIHLERAYFSAFHPVPDIPLDNQSATPAYREFHLYQASFLLRDYGFQLNDLPFDTAGNLPANEDPKLSWARSNLLQKPIEINLASYHELLRIPGIGPRSARDIINERRKGKIKSVENLHKLGIRTSRLSPFVLIDGKIPAKQIQLL